MQKSRERNSDRVYILVPFRQWSTADSILVAQHKWLFKTNEGLKAKAWEPTHSFADESCRDNDRLG
ncbi:hypothetical protein Pla52o_03970 [Novipirellula galeiformis]|uniref:Uncharacterized protein n=1 Tax=Novipirellula galeiformis TaxID=2528004 RepID=A0A5C6CSK8_9BACT|nr:hypothetical protein Pla52o_03970 [Novipirellula galeiformis]